VNVSTSRKRTNTLTTYDSHFKMKARITACKALENPQKYHLLSFETSAHGFVSRRPICEGFPARKSLSEAMSDTIPAEPLFTPLQASLADQAT
jgi:hypothetical protein